MKTAYSILAQYYDLIFHQKNYQSEAEFIRKIVRKRCPQAKSILDIGCGTGNHLRLLQNDFQNLFGLDINQAMLDEAKRKSPKINCVLSDMTTFQLQRQFDVVICLFAVFNYNLSIDDAEKVLLNFKNHLLPGGVLIVELKVPQQVDKYLTMKTGKNDLAEVIKINQHGYDPTTQIETTDYALFIKVKKRVDFFVEPNHKHRIFQINDFENLLKQIGFKDIAAYNHFNNDVATPESRYPVFIASAG